PSRRIGRFPEVDGRHAWTLPQEVATPGDGQVRALIVAAGNPALTAPDGRGVEQALARLELVVGLALYVTETTKRAHYLLPVPTFLERQDVAGPLVAHMPRSWIHATEALVSPPPEVREEWRIYEELAQRMGLKLDGDLEPRDAVDRQLRSSCIG